MIMEGLFINIRNIFRPYNKRKVYHTIPVKKSKSDCTTYPYIAT